MLKQIQVEPAPAPEDSTKQTPSMQSSASGQAPSLRGAPSRQAPSVLSVPSGQAPSPRRGSSEETSSLRRGSSEETSSPRRGSSEQVPTLLTVPSERKLLKQEPTSPQELPLPITRKDFLESTNWCFAAIGLMFVCMILVTLVIIMSAQVDRLSKKSKEQIDVMKLQILVLTEILRQLQTGKVQSCSVCKVEWVQHAGDCYLFRGREMSWYSSMGFCKDEFATLAVIKTPGEMEFLRQSSYRYFDLPYGHNKFHKFWIGLKYDADSKQWIWADGTRYDPKLNLELVHNGCIYLQNGKLKSQQCHEGAYIICKTKVQFGWN